MNTCNHAKYDQARAQAAVKHKVGAVMWKCGECEAIHVGTADQVGKGTALMSNCDGKVIALIPAKITSLD